MSWLDQEWAETAGGKMTQQIKLCKIGIYGQLIGVHNTYKIASIDLSIPIWN